MNFPLIAAPHTPLTSNFDLNLDAIALQAGRLVADGVAGAFICGSTGEGHSLTVEEREQVAERWAEAPARSSLKLIVHVGHLCQRDSARLARNALNVGADAIAAHAPGYFKPASVHDLIAFCEPIAQAAAPLPFYYYDIPALTGVHLSSREFLEFGRQRIQNLAGIKYTNEDLMELQEIVGRAHPSLDILFGRDEALLAGFTLGVHGAVGSTYNFAAPHYRKMLDAAATGDLETAQRLQRDAVDLIRILQSYGYMAAAKSIMRLRGIDCGPVRSPLGNLTRAERDELATRILQHPALQLDSK